MMLPSSHHGPALASIVRHTFCCASIEVHHTPAIFGAVPQQVADQPTKQTTKSSVTTFPHTASPSLLSQHLLFSASLSSKISPGAFNHVIHGVPGSKSGGRWASTESTASSRHRTTSYTYITALPHQHLHLLFASSPSSTISAGAFNHGMHGLPGSKSAGR